MTEQEVLRKLDIPDFRHMTKDKMMSFASMMNNMDPEVAKKAIEQFPEFTKMASAAMEDYRNVFEKAVSENTASSKQCYDIYNRIMSSLERCLAQEDISFEEKKYYIDEMKKIAEMANEKDSQNKNFLWKALQGAAVLGIVLLGIAAAALGGGEFGLGLPSGDKK